jgi:hypothetical protein
MIDNFNPVYYIRAGKAILPTPILKKVAIGFTALRKNLLSDIAIWKPVAFLLSGFN